MPILNRRAFLASTAAAAALTPRFAAAQGAELQMWTPGGSELFCNIHTGLIQGFASRTEGLSGAAVQCGLGQDTEFTQALIASIASSSPPDISMLWDSPVALGSQGAFMPLDDMMAGSRIPVETWPAGLLASCQFRGQTFGLPVTAGVYTMWYNEELFESKGISSARADFPKTWADMRALSKEFTVWNGDRLEVAGFMPPRVPETMAIWSALNGGMLFDGDNLKYTIDSEQNVEMMQFFLDWLDEEYKGDINLVDRSGNFMDGYPNSTTGLGPAFREGRLAGMQSGSWLMGDIYGDPAPVFERWNLAAHPVGPSGTNSVSGTWPNWFVIPARSANPEAAFAYLEYLSLEGVVDWYRQIPDVPTNSQVTAPTPDVIVNQRGAEVADDITAFLQEQAAIVTPMWNSPSQSFGADQVARALEKIYTKAATVAEALADAQSAAQAELDRVLAG
jgi:ABC-type glycerol-3-phosphate transport system substrate-binding protein